MKSYTKTELIDGLKQQLATKPAQAIKGLLTIASQQTSSELKHGYTNEDNGVGFTGTDANLLTSFAVQVQQWNSTPADSRQYDSPLSQKQMDSLMKKMPKYASQLIELAIAKGKYEMHLDGRKKVYTFVA